MFMRFKVTFRVPCATTMVTLRPDLVHSGVPLNPPHQSTNKAAKHIYRTHAACSTRCIQSSLCQKRTPRGLTAVDGSGMTSSEIGISFLDEGVLRGRGQEAAVKCCLEGEKTDGKPSKEFAKLKTYRPMAVNVLCQEACTEQLTRKFRKF